MKRDNLFLSILILCFLAYSFSIKKEISFAVFYICIIVAYGAIVYALFKLRTWDITEGFISVKLITQGIFFLILILIRYYFETPQVYKFLAICFPPIIASEVALHIIRKKTIRLIEKKEASKRKYDKY